MTEVNLLSHENIADMVFDTLGHNPDGLIRAFLKEVPVERRDRGRVRVVSGFRSITVGTFEFIDGEKYVVTGNRISIFRQGEFFYHRSHPLSHHAGMSMLSRLQQRIAPSS